MNYQQIYDFHMNLDFKQTTEDLTPPALSHRQDIDFKSKGGVGALTPAISMLVVPKLSVGVAINFYTDEFFGNYAWKQTTRSVGSGNLDGTNITTAYNSDTTFKNFQAINVTTGILWDIWEKRTNSSPLALFMIPHIRPMWIALPSLSRYLPLDNRQAMKEKF